MNPTVELFRALGSLAEPPREEHRAIACALQLDGVPEAHDYTGVFLFQLYPYASVYLSVEGMLGGDARDRVAGFHRALGLTPPPEPDHIASILSLYASLIDAEAAEVDAAGRAAWGHARAVFLWEHILSWLPVYLVKVSELAPGFYRRWAELLLDVLLSEARTIAHNAPPALHLREVPALEHPEGDPKGFIGGLLAPAVSGMIITRSDLARAAREAELGLRIGERAFILRSLFEQDADATLAWLEGEAIGWVPRHQRQASELGDVARHWKERAETVAARIREVRSMVGEVVAPASGV